MKVVINNCYGGFSLSAKAVKRFYELKGRSCYFFRNKLGGDSYQAITMEEAQETLFFTAFDVPNPDGIPFGEHYLDTRPENRTDPHLIQVVEELGKDANGQCAELSIIEIPDGIEWQVEEYDGREWVAEKHRTWS